MNARDRLVLRLLAESLDRALNCLAVVQFGEAGPSLNVKDLNRIIHTGDQALDRARKCGLLEDNK